MAYFVFMMRQLYRVYYVARILPKKQQTNPFRYTYHCIHRKLVKVQLLFRHFWPDVAFQQDLWLLLSSSMFWSKKQVFDSRQSLIWKKTNCYITRSLLWSTLALGKYLFKFESITCFLDQNIEFFFHARPGITHW